MSLVWVIVGSVVQLQLCVLLFLVVVSSASGIGDRRGPGRAHMVVLNACMVALPATALLSAVIVVCLYLRDGDSAGYWWYALPLIAAALYAAYASGLARRESAHCTQGFVLRRR